MDGIGQGEARRLAGGIVVDDGEVRIDVAEIRKLHDVNDGDPNCAMCGVEYPCELLEIAERLADWLQSAPSQTPAPGGAGQKRE